MEVLIEGSEKDMNLNWVKLTEYEEDIIEGGKGIVKMKTT